MVVRVLREEPRNPRSERNTTDRLNGIRQNLPVGDPIILGSDNKAVQ